MNKSDLIEALSKSENLTKTKAEVFTLAQRLYQIRFDRGVEQE